MDQLRIVLGIEICKDVVRIAEVEHRSDGFFLSRIAEKNIKTLNADELVQKISLILREEKMRGRIASVAIDTTLTERDTIDVDADLQTEEIANFLKAEIDFHNDFSPREFKPAYEVTKTLDGYNEIFYAAIDKTLIADIKNACTRCGLSLKYIDLDHSCSELAINKLFGHQENHILITVKDRQVEGSVSRNGQRLAYKYCNYPDEPLYL